MAISIRVSRRIDVDVVVVGAGPGGTAAAIALAEGGARVLMLDRARFPRDKVCGDFVGPVGILELKRLGLTDLPEYKASYVVREASLYLDGAELIRNDVPQVSGLPRHGRVIPRLVLDNWLFERARRAGVAILEDTKFTGHRFDGDALRIEAVRSGREISITASLLIGADGTGSRVARSWRGHAGRDSDRIIAVRGYYSNVDAGYARAELYFSEASFPGYYWFFPTSATTANVGVGMVGETIPSHGEHLRTLLLDLVENDPALRARLGRARLDGPVRGWPLATYNPRDRAAGDRVLLVGDAAGLINPLNGEGIQYALLSGRWAAEVALDCLAARDCSNARLDVYDRRLKDNLRYDMALAQMIVQLIRNRDLNPVWLSMLQVITRRARRDDEYARIAGGILAGLLPARQAISRRLLGGTALEAARQLAWAAVWNGFGVRRPEVVVQVGLQVAGVGFQLAYDAAADPRRMLRWGESVAASAWELGVQVIQNAVRSASVQPAATPPQLPPAADEAPLSLRA